ncbi:MAG: radical SAM protein [Cytophagales bacterium]|nr:radical SAM protein [Cytophagales bacterium]
MTNTYPEKKNLYRLPYSMNDNPIGWIEATDICNIKCKGCYRLVMGEGHKPVQQIKDEILFLKKWRNCDNISLAGGEPILHPDIKEIVSFIVGLKMKVVILTNGLALNDKILKEMKEVGLLGFSFHIDITQTRPEFKKKKLHSELELNDMRLGYAKMLKKYNFYSHFGITVTPENLHEVPELIRWAKDNILLINGISLIIYRGLPVMPGVRYFAKGEEVEMEIGKLGYTVSQEEYEKINVRAQDVYAVIKKHFPDYEAMGYLGGTADHTSFKWLWGSLFVNTKGKTFGALGRKTLELAQAVYHFTHGTYLVYPNKRIGKTVFLMSIFDPLVRKAFWKFIKYCLINPLRFFYPMKSLGIGMVQAPDLLENGKIDMCDDCPDMCVFEGKLVNSCRLDECRIFGDLLTIQVEDEIAKKKRESLQESEMI